MKIIQGTKQKNKVFMERKKIIGLMACDSKGVIGKDRMLPWSYPEELEHFRNMTYQKVMVMGNTTFQSIPSTTLKNRFNIVFSRQQQKSSSFGDNIVFVSSMNDFLRLLNMLTNKEIFMIGGAEITRLFLMQGLLSEFILTKIHKAYEGDTYLSLDFLHYWEQEVICQKNDFTIYRYTINPNAR